MFSFFKRFKSGGNKAAETSPASTESLASDALAPSPEIPETPASPSLPVEDAAAKADIAPAVVPASVPAEAAQAPTAPIDAAPPPVTPVQNAVPSEPAQANVPSLITPAQSAPTFAPQIAPEQAELAEPVEPIEPIEPIAPISSIEPAAPPPAVVVKDAHGDAIGEIVAAPAQAPAAKRSWLTRLKAGLSKTSAGLTGIFIGVKVDENLFEELEDALLMSDAGVEATAFLIGALRKKVKTDRLTEGEQVKRALHDLLVELLQPLEQSLVLGRESPMVVMIAGVNGAGKTTSIGKLAKHFQHYGQSVLLAAGDTFRAAAREQLAIWGERNNVAVVSQENGDPAAVVFDAVTAARARKIDIVMADTAGRLPTQLHLMEELKKIRRVLGKAAEGAPHEVLLVIDANTGQNALTQVKAFDDALQLTGLIVTKLDGTAKGGILAAIARQRPVPVYFIGVGEKVEDLQPFSAREFADALLG
ncbi:signal recognition particle-docking protein FtsY [Pandoraea sp. XJJ-1]|uniref:signal recognition particle-docking protein FtsY n=1 Tax=Pandoraea sp. XJJ-1 TaxID=3002643 RepID=UPI00228047A2|nr:signal recognition particle-docking protein FtsY [Pandoraea sp. XJJ-1]WAL83368.1 signal recognition particle-docking protein FtsY [Pandoraea sp. XJJ-1]